MKKLGRIAAAFMASVFFVTGIPAMTAFAADEVPAAEETVTETPVVEPVTEQPTVPETPAPVVTEPVVTEPTAEGNTEVVAPTEPEVTEGKEDAKTIEGVEGTEVSGDAAINNVKIANAPLLADAEPNDDAAEQTVTIAGKEYKVGDTIPLLTLNNGKLKSKISVTITAINGNNLTMDMTISGTSYTKVYIGAFNEDDNYPNVLEGTLVDSSYVFSGVTATADEVNTGIYIVPYGSSSGWYHKDGKQVVTGINPVDPMVVDPTVTIAGKEYKVGDTIPLLTLNNGKLKSKISVTITAINGNNLTMDMTIGGTSYTKVYIGAFNEDDNYPNVLEGTLVDSSYVFSGVTATADEINTGIYIVPYGSSSGWYHKDGKQVVTGVNPVDPAEANQSSANSVIDKIAAIGEVTLDSESAITAARTAYDNLADDQKALVTNLSVLEAAEAKLAELKAAENKTQTINELQVYKDSACTETYGMFVIQNASVTENANGTITLTFNTVEHKTFDKIYFGQAKDSSKDTSKIFKATGEDSEGYKFVIAGLPKSYQNSVQPIQFGKPNGEWNPTQRYLAIPKANNSSLTDDELAKNQETSSANAKKVEEQAEQPANNNDGSTSAVDNSTNLPDGIYTPDSFGFSGGSGRVTINCTQVRVTGGKAYATIVFNSDKFGYVKASGQTFYPTVSNGTSIFEIPIALNQNNTIIGLTTAMSQPHEITYSIFVYIEGAGGQTGGIPGLELLGEEKLEYAEYFKLFNYADGIKLLEIDMQMKEDEKADAAKKDDTTSSTEVNETTKKNAALHDDEELLAETVGAQAEEAEDDGITTTADAQAELYKGNVIKYLLVPENVEIPAGLEKEVIVINLPVESVYSGSDEISEIFKELKIEDLITSQVEEDKENKEIVAAGDYKDLDLKSVIKSKCDLVILPEESIEAEDVKDEKAQKEVKENFESLTEDLANLNVPVIVDRADYEENDEAKAEWIKIFGILFNCEKEANELFKTMTK